MVTLFLVSLFIVSLRHDFLPANLYLSYGGVLCVSTVVLILRALALLEVTTSEPTLCCLATQFLPTRDEYSFNAEACHVFQRLCLCGRCLMVVLELMECLWLL